MSPTETEARPEDGVILQHHFDDLGQQKASSVLGMWAFLATEVMLFGALFGAYSVYRAIYPAEFIAGSQRLNVIGGAINTAVLLCSSLTMALAVHASQVREPRRVVRYLLLTIVFGTAFLGIKGWEWSVDYHEKLIPGINFDWAEFEAHRGHSSSSAEPLSGLKDSRETADSSIDPDRLAPAALPSGKVQIFFLLYFLMTGLHALHMIIGLTLVGITAYLAHKNWFSGGGGTQIEIVGLYWHFIDVVWVFLYPLLYLIDVRR